MHTSRKMLGAFLTATWGAAVLLAILALVGCQQVPAVPPNVSPATVGASVVIMRASLPDFSDPNAEAALVLRPRCGGTAIGEHLIITAAHCVTESPDGLVRFVPRDMWFQTARGALTASIAFADAGRDVAYLRTSAVLQYVPVREASFLGEDVVLVRALRDFSVTETHTSRRSGHINVPVDKGDSGSGIFGSDGAFLGLVTDCYVPKHAPEPRKCIREDGADWAPAVL